jgi:hypothetical protein
LDYNNIEKIVVLCLPDEYGNQDAINMRRTASSFEQYGKDIIHSDIAAMKIIYKYDSNVNLKLFGKTTPFSLFYCSIGLTESAIQICLDDRRAE